MKRFCRLFALALCLALIFQITAINASAEKEAFLASGYCGGESDGKNISWQLSSDGVLTVSGSGKMQSSEANKDIEYQLSWYPIASEVKKVIIEPGVTEICDNAFNDCYILTEVSIPHSVISIGEKAFKSCYSLYDITVDAANPAYCSVDGVLYSKDMTSVIKYPSGKKETSYSIPDSVTSIGAYSFKSCLGLTQIAIPQSAESIGDSAFSGCIRLTSIEIPSNVVSIGKKVFDDCRSLSAITVDAANPAYSSFDGVLYSKDMRSILRYPQDRDNISYSVPEGVTAIEDSAFRDCGDLTSIEIPESVTTIGSFVFFSCGLTNMSIPQSVTYIGDYAFANCESLRTIELPNGITSISEYTFFMCQFLDKISIPESVESIGEYAFYSCYCLDRIDIPSSVKSIDPGAFQGSGLIEATISESTTDIDSSAFSGCPHLLSITVSDENPVFCSVDGVLFSKDKTTLVSYPDGKGDSYIIPDGTENIGTNAFMFSKLKSITIPESVKSIGDCAFAFTSNLTQITLPAEVSSIGKEAFEFSKLKSIFIPDSVKTIGINAFSSCQNLNHIYCEAKSKPDGWDEEWLSEYHYTRTRIHWGYDPVRSEQMKKIVLVAVICIVLGIIAAAYAVRNAKRRKQAKL